MLENLVQDSIVGESLCRYRVGDQGQTQMTCIGILERLQHLFDSSFHDRLAQENCDVLIQSLKSKKLTPLEAQNDQVIQISREFLSSAGGQRLRKIDPIRCTQLTQTSL